MAVITINAESIPNRWQAGGSTLTLQIVAGESFHALTDALDTVYVQSGRVGVLTTPATLATCTISGDDITIPAIELYTTTDSPTNEHARYAAANFYDSDGVFVGTLLADFAVPHNAADPLSWAYLTNYRNAQRRSRIDTAQYSRTQTDIQIAQAISAIVTNPASTSVRGNVLIDTAPADLNAPTAVGINSARVSRVLESDYANSLSAAIAAIGATPTKLVIKSNTTGTGALVFPDNILLVQENEARIIDGGGCTIEFEDIGLFDPESRVPFFEGFSAGDITWTGANYPKKVSSELLYVATDSLTTRVNFLTAAFAGKASKSFATSDVNTGTDVITEAAHGYPTGQRGRFTTTGTLPAGLSLLTDYWLIAASAGTYKVAQTYTKAIAGTAIDLTTQGTGTHTFVPAPLQVNFICYPRTITGTITLNDNHSMYLQPGEFQNTCANGVTPVIPGNNSIIDGCNRTAIFYESATDFATRLIWTKDGAENVKIQNIHFKGQGAADNASNFGAWLQGASNSTISGCWFQNCHSYNAGIGGLPSQGSVPVNCSIENNLFTEYQSQNIAITRGIKCKAVNNVLDYRGSTGLGFFVPIDLEPNNSGDRLEDIEVSGNKIYTSGVSNFYTAVQVQGAIAGAGAKRIRITDNEIVTIDDLSDVHSGRLQFFALATGCIDLVISRNKVSGSYVAPVMVSSSRHVTLDSNRFLQNDGMITLIGVAEGFITDNIGYNTYPIPGGTGIRIVENEHEYSVTSAGSVITNLGILDGGSPFGANKFYEWFDGLSVTFNASDYEIDSVNPAVLGAITATTSVGTVTQKTFVAADVTTGTGNIVIPSHGRQTGARERLTNSGGALPGNLAIDTTYFVIRVDANNIKYASTLANALAGTAITFSSAGTGTQTAYPVLRGKFSSNKFKDNEAPDGIFLESTGTSRILGDYSRTVSDFYAPAQITANQNNYNPGRNSYRIDLSTDASRNITGLVFTSPPMLNGEQHLIYNAGSFNIVLVHQSASSTAANRFLSVTGADITLTPNQYAVLEYITAGRWLVSRGFTTLAASEITNTPAGDIAGATVQAAIDELDTEKVPKARTVVPDATATITTTAADSGKLYRLTHGVPTFTLPTTGLTIGLTVFYIASTADVTVSSGATVECLSWDGGSFSATSIAAPLMYGGQLMEVRYVASGKWSITGVANGS